MALISIITLATLGPFIMANLLTAASLVTILLVAGYFYYQNQFKYFERQGLKNPPPWPVVGNLLSMFSERRFETEKRWLRDYGKMYGAFHGSRPRYIIADPEILRQICIKDFDAFPNHEKSELLTAFQSRFIFFLQDDQWKRVRALQSPTFTSGKMKRMYKLLGRCAADLADCFNEQLEQQQTGQKGVVVQLKDIYGLYTMDGIASCGYGLKLERQRGTASIEAAATRNEFVAAAMAMFKFRPFRLLIAFSFPIKLLAWLGYHPTPSSVFDRLARKVRAIIDARRKSTKHFDDYLQLLLDAKLDDRIELEELDKQENHHAGLSEKSLLDDQAKIINDLEKEEKSISNANGNGNSVAAASLRNQKQLDEEDVLAGAIFLLAVGLETTGTLLTHCTYALAHHPKIQEQLYQTVKSMAKSANGDEVINQADLFDYESITSCAYLDAVISETLRIMPPLLALDRVAKRDYYVEKYKVTIPAGSKLQLAFYEIMNDPDNWPQPESFKPERFMPENRDKIVPGSYCPFGLGPRHCLGMRFSLTEAKLGLATVLMRFRFEPVPGTPFPPLAKPGVGLGNIKTPQVIVKRR